MFQQMMRNLINADSHNEREAEFIRYVREAGQDIVKRVFTSDGKPLIDLMSEIGFLDVMIKLYEKETTLVYTDIKDVKPSPNVENLVPVTTLAQVGIFSTIIDEKVTFFVSQQSHIFVLREKADIDDYDIFLAFPWEISDKNIKAGIITEGGDVVSTKKVIMATGQPQIDKIVGYFPGFKVLEIVEYRENLIEAGQRLSPDILVVSDNIGGTAGLLQTLIRFRSEYKGTRIIYFTTPVGPRDQVKLNMLATLVSLGVYDIIFENKLSIDLLKHLLKNPRSKEAVERLVGNAKENPNPWNRSKEGGITLVSDSGGGSESSSVHSLKNVYGIMSSKGGTGKTFIAANVALSIDKYSLNNLQGKKPKIALIDGDICGNGLTNYFKAANNDNHFLRAMEIINTVIDVNKNGKPTTDERALTLAVEKTRECFVHVKNTNGIYLLGGKPGAVTEDDIKKFNPYAIVFLVELICKEYDIVIADITSDFVLSLWYPFLMFSRELYSVVNMEYNSVAASLRHNAIISDFCTKTSKIKYVLNRCIENEALLFGSEQIKEMASIESVSEVPEIERMKMVNDLYEGKFLINESSKEYSRAKYEIFRLANRMWPIKDFEKLQKKAAKESGGQQADSPKNFGDVMKYAMRIIFPYSDSKKDSASKPDNIPDVVEIQTEEEGADEQA